MGVLYYDMGYIDKALEYYLIYLDICKKLNHKSSFHIVYMNMLRIGIKLIFEETLWIILNHFRAVYFRDTIPGMALFKKTVMKKTIIILMVLVLISLSSIGQRYSVSYLRWCQEQTRVDTFLVFKKSDSMWYQGFRPFTLTDTTNLVSRLELIGLQRWNDTTYVKEKLFFYYHTVIHYPNKREFRRYRKKYR